MQEELISKEVLVHTSNTRKLILESLLDLFSSEFLDKQFTTRSALGHLSASKCASSPLHNELSTEITSST